MAWPLVAICVKDRNTESDSVFVFRQESPLLEAAVQLAPNVVEQPNLPSAREVFEEALDQSQCVVLFFAGGSHVYSPERTVMTTK